MITLSEPSLGKISISFDDITQRSRYEMKNYTLEKINFKTVLASIKGTHPQIISATFTKSEVEEQILSVKVSYEFLPEIVEKLAF